MTRRKVALSRGLLFVSGRLLRDAASDNAPPDGGRAGLHAGGNRGPPGQAREQTGGKR